MRRFRQMIKPVLNATRLWFLGLVLALGASLAPYASAAETTQPKKIIAIEGITEYRLDNGLRLLLLPDPSSPRITVNMTVLVGSRHEGYGETGMAHLLEHMLFKGTPTHANISKALRDRGADFNGVTTADRTFYYETLPAGDANLAFALKLEADRLVNCFVKRDDLVSEMTVVRNEFERDENSPPNILRQRMAAAAYEWHNYGKTVMGNQSDIERVPVDRLQAFYRKYYQPDNVVLIIAGKFDESKTLELVSGLFGSLKRPARKLEETYTEEPAQDGERTVVLRRVGSVAEVAAMYHVPASRHEDYRAIQVLANILTAEPNGRLYEALVKPGKATSIGAGAPEYQDAGTLMLVAEVDAKKSLEEARDALIRVVETFATVPVTDEEVQKITQNYARAYEQAMTNSSGMAQVLSSCAGRGDWRLFFLDRDRLARVTAADVMRVAGRYLRQSNRTVGMFVPTQQAQRVLIPAAPPAAELVKAYGGDKPSQTAKVSSATSENLDKQVQRSVLAGGVKTALLPKKTRDDTVTALLKLHYGNERSLNESRYATVFLAMLMMRGTKHHDRQQLEDELNKLPAGIQATGRPGELTFFLQSKKDGFPGTLRLLREILREPAFLEKELEPLKREMKQGLEKGLTDPASLAGNAMQRKLYPYPPSDIRYEPTIEETIAQVEAVTVEQIRRLYAEQLGGQVGEFIAIGDFDASSTRTLLEEALNGWQAKVAYEPIARPARTDVLASRQDILTPDKANAFFAAGQPLAIQADDPDCVALQMADAIFSGRLFDRVRQKEGLSYTVQSELDVADRYPRAEFNIMAICNPQNIDKVERAIAEELKKFISEGISQEELATARNALLQQQTLHRSGDGYLVGVLMDYLTLGRAFDYDSVRDRKRAQLTATEVNQAIRRHLAADRLMIVRAGDFKKDATKTSAATATPAAPAEATARPSPAPASSSSSKAMEPAAEPLPSVAPASESSSAGPAKGNLPSASPAAPSAEPVAASTKTLTPPATRGEPVMDKPPAPLAHSHKGVKGKAARSSQYQAPSPGQVVRVRVVVKVEQRVITRR